MVGEDLRVVVPRVRSGRHGASAKHSRRSQGHCQVLLRHVTSELHRHEQKRSMQQQQRYRGVISRECFSYTRILSEVEAVLPFTTGAVTGDLLTYMDHCHVVDGPRVATDVKEALSSLISR
ncbi:hypothetical protein E2C01_070041 [Portunus trituberculatus]|uniref:Uncharacterized protein n=1 Tax=Portunus trituberculatus TaxID=210409 RepID=A0A5B7I441_PORTR|nr:hypothetical protein [Portunus trituberculatus]